jgi:hypothetical protein
MIGPLTVTIMQPAFEYQETKQRNNARRYLVLRRLKTNQSGRYKAPNKARESICNIFMTFLYNGNYTFSDIPRWALVVILVLLQKTADRCIASF